jgi:hypothetical protein
VPHASAEPPKAAVEASTAAEGSGGGDDGAGDGDSDLPESIEELKGKKLFISVFVDGIRGLDPSVAHGSFVKFRTFMGDEPRRTPDVFKKINPRFAYHTTFANAVTADFIKYIATAPLEMEVWGLPAPAAPPALLAPVPAPTTHATEQAKAAPHSPSALEASPAPAPAVPAVAAAAATTAAPHEPLKAAPAHGEVAAAASPTTESTASASASAAAAPPATHALGNKTSATVAPEPAPSAPAPLAPAPSAATPAAASTAKPPEPAAAKGCCAVA